MPNPNTARADWIAVRLRSLQARSMSMHFKGFMHASCGHMPFNSLASQCSYQDVFKLIGSFAEGGWED